MTGRGIEVETGAVVCMVVYLTAVRDWETAWFSDV
jgi:hypothetical protein